MIGVTAECLDDVDDALREAGVIPAHSDEVAAEGYQNRLIGSRDLALAGMNILLVVF